MFWTKPNPVPKSWLALEDGYDGTWKVVRCYPDMKRVVPVREKLSLGDACDLIRDTCPSFGNNAEVD